MADYMTFLATPNPIVMIGIWFIIYVIYQNAQDSKKK